MWMSGGRHEWTGQRRRSGTRDQRLGTRCECQRGCSLRGLLKPGPRRATSEARMWVSLQAEEGIRDQRGRPTRGAQIGAPIGPFAEQRLNKALGFAVGPRRVGACKPMAELPGAADAGKAPRFVSGAIVREQAAHGHTPAAKPAEGVLQKRGAGAAALRAADFDKGHARRIINGDMDVLIADAAMSHRHVPVDAMANATDSTERFDVQVQEIAGVRPLVALNHRRGLPPAEPVEARALGEPRAPPARGAERAPYFPPPPPPRGLEPGLPPAAPV